MKHVVWIMERVKNSSFFSHVKNTLKRKCFFNGFSLAEDMIEENAKIP